MPYEGEEIRSAICLVLVRRDDGNDPSPRRIEGHTDDDFSAKGNEFSPRGNLVCDLLERIFRTIEPPERRHSMTRPVYEWAFPCHVLPC